jgi:hypothetical protein
MVRVLRYSADPKRRGLEILEGYILRLPVFDGHWEIKCESQKLSSGWCLPEMRSDLDPQPRYPLHIFRSLVVVGNPLRQSNQPCIVEKEAAEGPRRPLNVADRPW